MSAEPEELKRAVVCPGCGRLVGAGEARCAHCGHRAPGLFGQSHRLRRLVQRLPSYAWLLLLLVIGQFLLTAYATAQKGGSPASMHGEVLRDFGALQTFRVFGEGQWWRLVTYLFLHGDWMHLLFNGLFLLWVGRAAEAHFGKTQFFVGFLGTGVFAGLASLGWKTWASSPAPTVGASGALFGLAGLMLVHGLRRKDAIGRQWVSAMVNLLLLNGLLVLFLGGSVAFDHSAHLGGLAGGALLALVLKSEDQRVLGESPRWMLGALLGWGLVLGCVARGDLHGFRPAPTTVVDGTLRRAWLQLDSIAADLVARPYPSASTRRDLWRYLGQGLDVFERETGRRSWDAEGVRAAAAVLEVGEKLHDLLKRADQPEELPHRAQELRAMLELVRERCYEGG